MWILVGLLILLQVYGILTFDTLNSKNLQEIHITRGETTSVLPCNRLAKIDPGASVQVTSPNFPYDYPNSEYCLRTIVASKEDSKLHFFCRVFDLASESISPCRTSNDHLKIWESNPRKSKSYCGSEGPNFLKTSSGIINIAFYTNHKQSKQGFDCTVTAINKNVNQEASRSRILPEREVKDVSRSRIPPEIEDQDPTETRIIPERESQDFPISRNPPEIDQDTSQIRSQIERKGQDFSSSRIPSEMEIQDSSGARILPDKEEKDISRPRISPEMDVQDGSREQILPQRKEQDISRFRISPEMDVQDSSRARILSEREDQDFPRSRFPPEMKVQETFPSRILPKVKNGDASWPQAFSERKGSPPFSSSPCKCGKANAPFKTQDKTTTKFSMGIHEFPWMGLVKVSKSNYDICGATLINENFLLTSATCVSGTSEEYVSVVLGEHNVLSRTETNRTKIYQVKDLTIHPAFNRTTFKNDIALIELKQSVTFDPVRGFLPICLPQESLKTEATEGEIFGWQSFPWAPQMKENPEKVTVNFISRIECSEALTSFNVLPSMICVKNSEVGTCKSDVGGALIVIENGRYFLIGIGSVVQDCRNGETPAIYTDIRAHLHWIMSKTRGSTNCLI